MWQENRNMATIRVKCDFVVILSGDMFIASSKGSEEEHKIPGTTTGNGDADSSVDDNKNSGLKNCVLASAFSPSGKYFAVGDDYKQLHVYKVSPHWELLSTRTVARRCTAITFPYGDKEVVISDRTGDLYRYSLVDFHADGELLLGHLSMVLDVVLTADNKYIVTCDRDEKIRISHYPNSYNIHSFCLFHTEYVSQILFVKEHNCLISGSGDGKIALWTLDGKLLDSIDAEVLTNKANKTDDSHQSLEHFKLSHQIHSAVAQDLKESVARNIENDSDNDFPGVKKVVYSSTTQTLAVICYKSKLINFFTLQCCNQHLSLTRQCSISAQAEPWDICFDESNNTLWLVQPCTSNPVVAYTCERDTNGILQVHEASAHEELQQVVDRLCSKWHFFQASTDCQKQLINLQKMRTVENIQNYLQRKEERINSQKKKNKVQEPPEKKIKAI